MKTPNATGNNSELKEFFINHLKMLYWAEKKIIDTLPDMEEAATSQELKNAFLDHLQQTQQHVYRLEQVFNIIGEDADTSKCKIMSSIADAGSSAISETEDGSALRDVGLIFSGQMVEHYEIAFYGNLVQWAKVLGYDDAADILSQTLAEEKETDALLTQIGERNVNRKVGRETSNA